MGWGGIIVVVSVTALLAALAAWMVRRIAPESSEAAFRMWKQSCAKAGPAIPFALSPSNLLVVLMAIGGGLALGREGPTVQIGAVIGHFLGETFRRDNNDRRVLLAAGAGAGLATAFNAPIAGAAFVLEELVGEFDVTISIATLGTSVGAIGVARLLLGREPDFAVPMLAHLDVGNLWSHLVLGIVLGVLGVAYSRAILGMIALQTRLNRIAVEWRAAAVGAIIGLVGWFAPNLIGGGGIRLNRP